MALLAASLCVACAGGKAPTASPDAAAVAPVDWSARVFSATTGRESSVAAMLDDLGAADIVLVGETHLDAATHSMELRILEGVADRKPGHVALSLEMFQRDVQAELDAYLAGTSTEADFLDTARPWHNYRTGYRPLVEAAKARGIPVVASNLPASLQMAFARGGAAARSKLEAEQARWLPEDIYPPKQSYWDRVARRLRDAGHGTPGELSDDDRTWSIQNLWDNCMADAAVSAHVQGNTVVHVAGAFHVEHGDGIAAQIHNRAPNLTVATVTIVATPAIGATPPSVEALQADYVVWVPQWARGPQDEHHAVNVSTEVRYRLSAPPVAPKPLPLLVWLGSVGSSVEADAAYWQAVTSGEAVVAILEPPYRSEQADLSVSGRWAWSDTYASDVSDTLGGIERISEYVSMGWPISGVVIAGEADGAAIALWAGLHDTVDGASIVSLNPTDLDRLAEAGIPESAPKGDPVVVVSRDDAQARTTFELAGRSVAGLQPIPTQRRKQSTDLVRKALGLGPAPLAQGPTKQLSLSVDTPIARQWADLLALAREQESGVTHNVVPGPVEGATPIEVGPENFEDGLALPLAPGAFGGTTMLVLSADTPVATLAVWKKLGDDDVVKNQSRFARLVVTTDDELAVALDDLAASGRRNVIIVPATFAASGPRMQDLKRRTVGHTDQLRVAWLPGLGGHWAAHLLKRGATHP